MFVYMIWKGEKNMNKEMSKLLTRTIVYILVIVNMILTQVGNPIVQFDADSVAQFVSCVVQIAVLVYGFWKNNSFTKNAQFADKILNIVKKGISTREEVEELVKDVIE